MNGEGVKLKPEISWGAVLQFFTILIAVVVLWYDRQAKLEVMNERMLALEKTVNRISDTVHNLNVNQVRIIAIQEQVIKELKRN
jgi:hypothetical protein